MKIVENGGSIFEYTEENGLISKDGVIVSGSEYEPVFTRDNEGKPLFCGILFKFSNKFLSLSGNKSSLV